MICIGDCNGDGMVTINEIIVLVNISLGDEPLSTCAAGHRNTVNVADVIKAVNNALYGCNVD